MTATASAAPWVAPPTWHVPREWPGERCFILCGGESLRAQRHLVPRLRGRVIAVKEGVLLRPDADVLFLSGEKTDVLSRPLVPRFRGTHLVVRGRSLPTLPSYTKRVTRTKDHERLCELRDHVCGYDSGTSAINLAYHFGATEIILLGYDMRGGRWFTGEHPHPMPLIPAEHFRRHMGPLEALAADCLRRGLRVVNASPISAVPWFEKARLEEFL
jgi:hypothetical protein